MCPSLHSLIFARGIVTKLWGCAGESCESNTKTIGCEGRSSKSGSNNRVFMQVWHMLHVMLWFGACTGGNSENGAGNIFPAHYKESSLACVVSNMSLRRL